jgi:hypothetical protein
MRAFAFRFWPMGAAIAEQQQINSLLGSRRTPAVLDPGSGYMKSAESEANFSRSRMAPSATE